MGLGLSPNKKQTLPVIIRLNTNARFTRCKRRHTHTHTERERDRDFPSRWAGPRLSFNTRRKYLGNRDLRDAGFFLSAYFYSFLIIRWGDEKG